MPPSSAADQNATFDISQQPCHALHRNIRSALGRAGISCAYFERIGAILSCTNFGSSLRDLHVVFGGEATSDIGVVPRAALLLAAAYHETTGLDGRALHLVRELLSRKDAGPVPLSPAPLSPPSVSPPVSPSPEPPLPEASLPSLSNSGSLVTPPPLLPLPLLLPEAPLPVPSSNVPGPRRVT